MNLVGGIALEHAILRDQALRAFGKEHFVAELDRFLHLAAFDQIGVRLEDRIDLLCVGNWLSFRERGGALDR